MSGLARFPNETLGSRSSRGAAPFFFKCKGRKMRYFGMVSFVSLHWWSSKREKEPQDGEKAPWPIQKGLWWFRTSGQKGIWPYRKHGCGHYRRSIIEKNVSTLPKKKISKKNLKKKLHTLAIFLSGLKNCLFSGSWRLFFLM